MSSRKIFRFAPSRLGVRAAQVWRLWRQGDEFYAAARDAIHATKISFHRNGNWSMRVGPVTKHFVAKHEAVAGWLYAASIQWIILPDSFVPFAKSDEDVLLIDVPEDHKLAINLFLSVGKENVRPSLPPEGGAFVWGEQLRHGRFLSVHAVALPLTEQNRETALMTRREATGFTVDQMPSAGDFYAEIAWITSRPELGNLVMVVPLSLDALRLKGSAL